MVLVVTVTLWGGKIGGGGRPNIYPLVVTVNGWGVDPMYETPQEFAKDFHSEHLEVASKCLGRSGDPWEVNSFWLEGSVQKLLQFGWVFPR